MKYGIFMGSDPDIRNVIRPRLEFSPPNCAGLRVTLDCFFQKRILPLEANVPPSVAGGVEASYDNFILQLLKSIDFGIRNFNSVNRLHLCSSVSCDFMSC